MQFNANAKINLGLFITGKREDRFHSLESIFIPVEWNDELLIEKSSRLNFSSSGLPIPGSGQDNLCIQAYSLLNKHYRIPPVDIHLQKNIPIGAGLGGGSSDAAHVLKALNQLNDLGLSNKELCQYADQLGSDCSFFIENKAAFVSGKGEKIDHSVKLHFNGYCLLIYPNVFISTKEAYALIQTKKASFDLREINRLDISQWKDHVFNDFEEGLFKRYPILSEIKQKLYEMGADYAAMSGSGSTLYALFKKKPDLKKWMTPYQHHLCQLSI